MSPLEKESVLASMTVLIDTREQPSRRAAARYKSFQIPYKRITLSYGDYSYTATLPDGSVINEPKGTVIPSGIVVERKMDLDELEGCFTRSRERFENEFRRATEAGCKVVLLVENATWENLINGRYHSKMAPKAYLASITAFMERYNVQVIFCREETSGRLIKELLYRNLKERIERGEFDG